MNKYLLLTLLFSSCAQVNKTGDSFVRRIDKLHMSSNPEERLQEFFGTKAIKLEGEIGLSSSSSNVKDTYFYFHDKKIKKMTFYSYRSGIDRVFADIHCKWKRNDKYMTYNGHTIHLNKFGECLDRKITIKYSESEKKYEVSWEWK